MARTVVVAVIKNVAVAVIENVAVAVHVNVTANVGVAAPVDEHEGMLRGGADRGHARTPCATGNIGNVLDRQHGRRFWLFRPA